MGDWIFSFLRGFLPAVGHAEAKAAHAQGNDAKGHRRRWMEMYEAIDAGRKDETSANDGNDAAVRYRYEAMEPGEKHYGRPRPETTRTRTLRVLYSFWGNKGSEKSSENMHKVAVEASQS